jgi:hypothetical protein
VTGTSPLERGDGVGSGVGAGFGEFGADLCGVDQAGAGEAGEDGAVGMFVQVRGGGAVQVLDGGVERGEHLLIAFGLTGTTRCPAASSASTRRPSGRSIATGTSAGSPSSPRRRIRPVNPAAVCSTGNAATCLPVASSTHGSSRLSRSRRSTTHLPATRPSPSCLLCAVGGRELGRVSSGHRPPLPASALCRQSPPGQEPRAAVSCRPTKGDQLGPSPRLPSAPTTGTLMTPAEERVDQ